MPIKIIKKPKASAQQAHTPTPYSLKLLKGVKAIKSAAAPASPFKPEKTKPAQAGLQPMRQDKSQRHARLQKLILQTIDGSLSGGM